MVDGGFGFHKVWRGIVKYVQTFDIEELKREAGISESDDAETPAGQAAPAASP